MAESGRRVILSVENVDKKFPRVHAVKNLSLKIYEGESVALLGPNGAGKTTLLEMIEGLQFPDSGEIFIDGLTYGKDEKKIRQLMGLAFQETRFPEKIRVFEALELFSAFYGGTRARIMEILELISLTEKKDAFVNNLSGGQRQRLALGIGIIQKPKIILLDEPSTGLDPHARREIWRIMADLKKQGSTLLLTTHYMEEAEELCERIVVLFKGKILADGPLEQLLDQHASHEIIEFKLKNKSAALIAKLEKLNKVSYFHFNKSTSAGVMHVDDAAVILPDFLKRVGRQNLESFAARPLTLDDLFIKMTGRHLDG
ncbi:MAG: ABC transporter ATP-binding protein [Spirochaetes bacterium]|nr:ABC transporter ATP-binding protein [Spirochaetota bacterium]